MALKIQPLSDEFGVSIASVDEIMDLFGKKQVLVFRGRKGLYVSPRFAVGIEGMDEIRLLHRTSTQGDRPFASL